MNATVSFVLQRFNTIRAMLSLATAVGLAVLSLGCSSGSDTGDSKGQTSDSLEVAVTTNEAYVSDRIVRLNALIAAAIPVAEPNWNCNPDDPKHQALDIITRLKSLTSNCVWSTNPDVIEVDLFCGPAAKSPCENLLGDLSRRTNAFESIDLSKMLQSRVLDGLQTSRNGFTTWNITDRGIRLIIDARGWAESDTLTK